ncbi:alginate export family protein [Vibrio fluminensis]|uniref:alginate export family protein n=1 Tax=Vibrio fluminensis TaxID=2783614 RepID=UPI001888C663|nr:alginate export family protein [Vibrio fluminensis]
MRLTVVAILFAGLSTQANADFAHAIKTTIETQSTNSNSMEKDKDVISAEYIAKFSHTLNEQQRMYLDARALLTNDSSVYNAFDDNSATANIEDTDHLVFKLNEFWWQYDFAQQLEQNSLFIGLKRHRLSPYWLDEEIESLSWQVKSTRVDWQLGLGQKFSSFNSSTSLKEEEKSKLYAWAEIESDWMPYHHWSLKGLVTKQYKDINESEVSNTYSSAIEGELWWLGAGLSHNWLSKDDPTSSFAYNLQAIQLLGNGRFFDFDSSTLRQRSISATALLAGIRTQVTSVPLYLGVTFAYSEGGQDASSTFIQTALASNKGKYAGNNDALYQFNYAFDPDLSNLVTGSIFSSYAFDSDWSVTGAISHYQKADSSAPISRRQHRLHSETRQKTLGTGLDLEASYRSDNFLGTSLGSVMRIRASHFMVDDALDHFQDETRLRFDITLKL